jgi:hypothetical protein
MKRWLYIVFFALSFKVQAQFILSSNTTVESCNEIDSCLSVNGSSFLYYDETKNEFFLKVDFSNFRGADSIDNWLNKVRDTIFYFRMIFPKEKFPVLAAEERRSFTVNGRIFYNNRWKEQPVEITLFNSQNNLMSTTSSNANYTNNGFESYKLNFSIPFVPSDFKTYPQLYYRDQTVKINVTLGRINMLRPGMENLLSEVYYLPNR